MLTTNIINVQAILGIENNDEKTIDCRSIYAAYGAVLFFYKQWNSRWKKRKYCLCMHRKERKEIPQVIKM